VALSAETQRRLEAVFARGLRQEAEALLVEECGVNLPRYQHADSDALERVRFAALKLSEGTLNGLCDAIQLAQDDWRDLLVAADFADDIHAHKNWLP